MTKGGVSRMVNRAYKFRIYPNVEQQALFAKTFGCVRKRISKNNLILLLTNQLLCDIIKSQKES